MDWRINYARYLPLPQRYFSTELMKRQRWMVRDWNLWSKYYELNTWFIDEALFERCLCRFNGPEKWREWWKRLKTAKNGRCRTTQVRTTLWRVFTQKKKMCVVLLTSFTWSYFTLFSYVASCCGDGGRWVVPKQHLLLQPFVRFKEKWGDFGGLFPCSCPAKGDKMGRNEWNAIKKKCPEDLRKARSCGQNASP